MNERLRGISKLYGARDGDDGVEKRKKIPGYLYPEAFGEAEEPADNDSRTTLMLRERGYRNGGDVSQQVRKQLEHARSNGSNGNGSQSNR